MCDSNKGVEMYVSGEKSESKLKRGSLKRAEALANSSYSIVKEKRETKTSLEKSNIWLVEVRNEQTNDE